MFNLAILSLVSIFFALNMGASGIAPSFAAAYGAGYIKRFRSVLLFGIFVVFGALILGKDVAVTVGGKLLARQYFTLPVAAIILVSATASLYLANILKIPQSTSQVTVGAVVGAGLYFKALASQTIFQRIIPAWILLPAASFGVTFILYRQIYPPRKSNLYLYEKVFANENKLRVLVLVVSCYVAFAIGSNNVGNVVGPLFGAGIMAANLGLLIFAPLFGLGAWFLGKGTIETVGKKVVPLGLVSSIIVSAVTATLLIVASVLGIPQSLVQLNLFAIFAVSCLKNGKQNTIEHRTVQKTLGIWSITPLLSGALSYFLLTIIKG